MTASQTSAEHANEPGAKAVRPSCGQAKAPPPRWLGARFFGLAAVAILPLTFWRYAEYAVTGSSEALQFVFVSGAVAGLAAFQAGRLQSGKAVSSGLSVWTGALAVATLIMM